VVLDLCCNTPLVEFILLDTASVGQSWRVENPNLQKRLYTILAPLKSASTYHYAVLARKCIQAGRVGLTLIVRTTLFIGTIENIEVIVINIIADKDIGD